MTSSAKPKQKLRVQALCSGVAIGMVSLGVTAAPLSLLDTPLFLTTSSQPNLILTLDDSLSMMRAYVPESLADTLAVLDGPRFKSATYNSLYYNPKLKYDIPTRSDGTAYTTSFTTAYFNGFDTSKGNVNLTNGYKVIAQSLTDQSLSDCTSYIAANNSNFSSCLLAKNPPAATSTNSFTATCSVTFNQRSGADRLELSSGCSPNFTGTGTPSVGTSISVTGTSTRNGTYTVTSVDSSNNRVEISQNLGPDITTTATLSWTGTASAATTDAVAAYYYLYYTEKANLAQPTGCDNNKQTDACYVKIVVGSADDNGDITAGTAAEKKQNFANWYSFYRNRALSVVSGAMKSVTGLSDDSVRMGWQTLNGCNSFGTTCKGYDNTNRENRIRKLSSAHKTNFYNWLQRFDLNGSTPLRNAMVRAGDYFTTNGINSPYAEDPYVTVGTELTCRRNYHVLFTDGLWNSSTIFSGNPDSSGDTTLPDGNIYSPQTPYKDVNTSISPAYTNSSSLADIAFHYWATDLRSGTSALANDLVPQIPDTSGDSTAQYWNPKNDPAKWQHMVNYTIGLGLSNSLISACKKDQNNTADPNNPTPGCPVWGGGTFEGDYAALKAGTKNWPLINGSPSLGDEPDGHVYDLWHAAINSRGKFYSADDPISLSSAFSNIVSTIVSTNAAAAAAAANSASLQEGTKLYQAQFSSQDWSGHLFNYSLNSKGEVVDVNGDGKLDGFDANWDAATLIPPASARNIKTFNGSVGVDFLWDNTTNANNLSNAQKTALKTSPEGVVGDDTTGQNRLKWLRGDMSQEIGNGGSFRKRPVSNLVTNVLGDLIDSDPVFTFTEDFGYNDLPSTAPEKSAYATFVAAKDDDKAVRPPVIYEGANDGMLHAFNAETTTPNSGRELFAYVPAAVYGNLSSLTATDYSHKYFVNGTPSVGDAYLSGAWKTVLVGGLGKGGKAIYALDVTTPATFSNTNVLWEYSGSTSCTPTPCTTDADGLGLTYSQPQIARLNNGTDAGIWAVIFGNGYNSVSEQAFLYIVDLSTGTLIKKIATNTATSNGLSSPRVFDINGDKIIDYVYAGDLQGNMWKFDLTNADSANWGVSYGDTPLFTARNASNQIQPITAKPSLAKHKDGVLVYFGTGSYLTGGDLSDKTVQTFYSVWDKPAASTTVLRSQLVQQTITSEIRVTGNSFQDCVNDATTTINECDTSFDLRTTSANTVDYENNKFGWYMDLVTPPYPPGTALGERVVSPALLVLDRVVFLTAIPSSDKCAPGGDSWLMEFDATSGSRTGVSAFDFTNDDKFDDKDKVATSNNPSDPKVAVSGMKSKVGMVKDTVWLNKEGTGIAVKELSGISSNIQTVKNRGAAVVDGVVDRLNWQQIQ